MPCDMVSDGFIRFIDQTGGSVGKSVAPCANRVDGPEMRFVESADASEKATELV